MDTHEQFFQCPYCWQQISMILDLSVSEQSFIEDCEGCCSPIAIGYRVVEGEVAELSISAVQP